MMTRGDRLRNSKGRRERAQGSKDFGLWHHILPPSLISSETVPGNGSWHPNHGLGGTSSSIKIAQRREVTDVLRFEWGFEGSIGVCQVCQVCQGIVL